MPAMRRLRCLLLGLLVGELVAFVSGGPRWHADTDPGAAILGFDHAGAACYTLTNDGRPCRAWDARTGATRETAFTPPRYYGPYPLFTELAADGRWLLSGERGEGDAFEWRLFDPTTGDLAAGPRSVVTEIANVAVSPDGRWLAQKYSPYVRPVAAEFHPLTGPPTSVRVAGRPGERFGSMAFADAGSQAAVLWLGAGGAAVETVALPDGRSQRRFALPPARGTWYLRSWHGDRLTAVDYPAGTPRPKLAITAFDLGTDPPRAGPTVAGPPAAGATDPTVWEGAGWFGVAWRVRDRPPTLADRALAWLNDRLGRPRVELPTTRVAFFDAAGRPQSAVAGWLPDAVCIAPDGRSVAALDPRGRLAVWDADPPAPWPRAVVAGLLTVGVTWGFDRWRRKGATR